MILFKPHFIGVGSAKSGTTYIADALASQKNIYIPKEKELHFFDHKISFKRLIKYNLNFCSKNKVNGEITPSYCLRDEYLSNIKKFCPSSKIFMIIRNPYERTLSHYCHAVNHFGKSRFQKLGYPIESLSLHDALISEIRRSTNGEFHPRHQSYIAKSLYSDQILSAIRLFNTNFRVFVFDDLIAGPNSFFDELVDFISDGKLSYNQNYPEKPNSRKNSQTNRSLDAHSKNLLDHYFLPEIDKLESLLCRSFNTWRP